MRTNYDTDGPYVKHGTTCKFCKKPITVEIAESYAALGDPHGIIPIATCDRCADLREERRKLEDKIRIAAMTLAAAKNESRKEISGRYRNIFEDLLKRYAAMIARWNYMHGMSWDDAATDTLMEHPDKWPDVLKTLWQIFYDSNKNRKATT